MGKQVEIEIDNNLLLKLISKVEQLTKHVLKTEDKLKEKESPYMTLKEVCAYTGLGKTWVYENRAIIGFSKAGGAVRFKRKDVEEFMQEQYFKQNRA